MNFYCREQADIRQMLIRYEVKRTKCFRRPNDSLASENVVCQRV
jgi:hypothetical protein